MFARGEMSGGVAKCRGVIGGRFWKGEQVFGDDLQWVGGHLKMKLCPMGADVQEEDIKMQGMKFNYKGQEWVVAEVKEASEIFRSQLGWTHIAGVKRPKGTKMYWANLFIADGAVVQSLVVL